MAVCREAATRSGVGHVTDGWVGGTDAERGSGRQCTGRGRGRLLRGGGRDCSGPDAVVVCTARTHGSPIPGAVARDGRADPISSD